MKGSQTTIKDIARILRISPSTVSRALQDHPRISEETTKAVQALAQKLDYMPNSVALSLVKSRTNTVGIIIPEIAHHFFSSAISGIEDIAYKAGYNVMICQSNESYERELLNTKALLSSRVDGLIVSLARETQDYQHFRQLQQRGFPLVFFDRVCQEVAASKVIVDDYEGAFMAVEHLISIGCKRIAHLSGPKNLLISHNRFNGYADALAKYGLPVDQALVVHCDLTLENGIQAARSLFDQIQPPDGIFAISDLVAIGAMLTIKEKGLKIPEEVAIIGFANSRYASFFEPSLSSIEQPAFEMGQIAAQLFLDQTKTDADQYVPETKILKTKLIVRASSAPKKSIL